MFLEDLEQDEKIIVYGALKKYAKDLEMEDVEIYSSLMSFYLMEGEKDV